MPQMTDELWRSLSGYLDVALDLTEAEREPWLSGIAASDPEMAALIAQVLGLRERQEFAEFLHGDFAVAKSAIAGASKRPANSG